MSRLFFDIYYDQCKKLTVLDFYSSIDIKDYSVHILNPQLISDDILEEDKIYMLRKINNRKIIIRIHKYIIALEKNADTRIFF